MKVHFVSGLPDFRPKTGTLTVELGGVTITLTDEMYDRPTVVVDYRGKLLALGVDRLVWVARTSPVDRPEFIKYPPEISQHTPLLPEDEG